MAFGRVNWWVSRIVSTARGSAHAGLCDGDVCPCTGDIIEDGQVDVDDLLELLGNWGLTGPSDLNESGDTDIDDLLLLLAQWASCE